MINSNPLIIIFFLPPSFLLSRFKNVEDFRFGIPKSCRLKSKDDNTYDNIISRSYKNLRLFGLYIALHNPQISQNVDEFDCCSLSSSNKNSSM